MDSTLISWQSAKSYVDMLWKWDVSFEVPDFGLLLFSQFRIGEGHGNMTLVVGSWRDWVSWTGLEEWWFHLFSYC